MSSAVCFEPAIQPLEVLHVGEGMDRRPAACVGLALPLEEAAAGRIVLSLEHRCAVLAHEPHDRGVGEGKRVLNLVPDDGGRADLKTSAGNGHRVDPAGIAEFVHQRRVAGFRLLAQQAGDDGTVGAMPPAGGTETAVEVRLDGDGRLTRSGRSAKAERKSVEIRKGAIVWELDGPGPTLNRSLSGTAIAPAGTRW